MRRLLLLSLSSSLVACSASGPARDAGADAGNDDTADAGPDAGMDSGMVVPGNPYCNALLLPTAAFIPGSNGRYRGDIAPDFTLPLYGDAGSWQFSAEFTGCDSYVFITDEQTVSSIDATPLAISTDWSGLIASANPTNVHYFFVSVNPNAAEVAKLDQEVAQQIAAALAKAPNASVWQSKLHVVAGKAQSLGMPIGPLTTGWGQLGFSIDRQQVYRGVGFLSDVTRLNEPTLLDAGWGYLGNLAYAANEAIYMNAQAIEKAQLDSEGATVLTLLDGGVFAQYVDFDATLPSASDLTAYDSLEVEVTQHCPDPTALEFNSCGAWDYIANLNVDDPSVPYDPDAGYSYLELARFITSYHRETHWVVDATPMLARLASGGTRHFQWSFAPPWNTQPTGTTVDLRFFNQNKGYRPEAILPLWTDSDGFNQTYDMDHPPVTVSIPADATRTELWMIITGHGSDAHECCEFCNHEHLFTVNDAGSFLVQFPEAGTESECIPEEANGMTPNQGGTWWYGRGGWCPGEQVNPHVYDVTSLVQPGQSATVTMVGEFEKGPPPQGGGGDVDLQSVLIVYH
jgi:hypothetical protein